MKGILSSKLATGMLMLAAFMANIFANMPCRGRCYEPMLPEELRHHTGSRFRNLHGRIAITPRNLRYMRTDPLYRRSKQHTIIIAY